MDAHLMIVIWSEYTITFKFLIFFVRFDTFLKVAAYNDKVEVVKLLLNNGADIDFSGEVSKYTNIVWWSDSGMLVFFTFKSIKIYIYNYSYHSKNVHVKFHVVTFNQTVHVLYMFQNGSLHACSLIPSHVYNNMFTHLNTCTCSFFSDHQNLCLDCKMLLKYCDTTVHRRCMCAYVN